MSNHFSRRRTKDRSSYFSLDGKYYCYERLDPETHCMVVEKVEIGKDVSIDITYVLEELDKAMDLNERHEYRYRDLGAQTDADLAASGVAPEELLFPIEEPANPLIQEVNRIVNTKFRPSQKKLYDEHFVKGRPLEEIRQEEIKLTGKEITPQAMTSRKNKLIDRAAKELGVKRAKRK